MFGCLKEIPFAFPKPPSTPAPVLGSILEDNPDPKYMLSDRLWDWLQAHRMKHQSKGNGFGYGLCRPDQVTRTLSARYYKDGSEILVAEDGWRNPRRLTPREALHLMGFTDSYAAMFGHRSGFPIVVSNTQTYKQLGNSVVPAVTESIARSLVPLVTPQRTSLGNAVSSMAQLPASIPMIAAQYAAQNVHASLM